MTQRSLDFEYDYKNIKDRIEELKNLSSARGIDLGSEIVDLETKVEELQREKYQSLSAWEKVLMARHPERPLATEYYDALCEDWMELHGDRLYGDDPAIVGGIGIMDGIPVTLIGHQKGKNTNDNISRNFGMPYPEGYRKAIRLMEQAQRFGRPVLTFVNTPGANPGMGAEERGQGWAISQSLATLAQLRVPVVCVIVGEGGSGGALALAVGDRMIMLSNSIFSVASPEACSSILFKDPERAEETAKDLNLTAQDLLRLGIADEIIEEPTGGAHRDFAMVVSRLKESLRRNLQELIAMPPETLADRRYQKLRNYHP